jgi:signal transduction histidine kinase
MNRKVWIFLVNLILCCAVASAQEVQKSELQQKAEAADKEGTVATARYMYIRAFEDYVNKGKMNQAVDCGVKATGLYYKRDNYWKEAFDLLRRIDDNINANQQLSVADKAALHYEVTKERLQMYTKLRKSASAVDQLNIMEEQVNTTGDANLKNDLLYNKAIYYYTFGLNAQGDAVFKEMAGKLTASKEYDKVDQAYQTLIANGRRSNSANLVAQSYKSYVAWKDSVNALKTADEIGALKQQIKENEEAISEKDSSLTARMAVIIGLCVLAAALAAALVIGGIVLMRFILLTRKQKNTIKMANENNALKAKFISNISAQLDPTLQKLDNRLPEVKALQDFSEHIQMLSGLENTDTDTVELEDTTLPPFCEALMDTIRDKVKSDVTLTVNAPKMSAKINKEYVSHILLHLLSNAAEYTPEGGSIWLEYKKRGAHAHQFLVSDTGQGIPEEKRDDVFKPFLEIRDLTTGDGLGLPICRQMALNMNGELSIDPNFTKGARFVLDLHS